MRQSRSQVLSSSLWVWGPLLVAACSRAPATPPAGPPVTMVVADDAAVAKPLAEAQVVGAAACDECHHKQVLAWRGDWHARALQRAEPTAVVGDFRNAHFRGTSSEAWMSTAVGAGPSHDGWRPQMRTRGADGNLREFPVDWVIGGKRMQDALTVFPDGRWQVLPVYWHTTGRAWVDYTESKQGALGPEHPFFWANFRRTANRECLDCHTTGLEVKYDPGSHAWSTHFSDGNVACEDCHGPGSRHAGSSEPADIVQPAKLARARGLDVCGQCHGPRNPLYPLLDAAHRFRPGDRYPDFYDPIVVLIAGRLSGDFFVDGRPRSSSFELQALLQSSCNRNGDATCLSCHAAPHQPHGPNELKPIAGVTHGTPGPDDACRGCHGAVASAGRAHTHHGAAEANRCVACHMPRVVSGVLDKFADHAIDVPAPENRARHDVPDACSTCHAALAPAALQRAIVGWWPNAPARQARRLRLADAIDDRTAKDSRQPLLEVIGDAREAPTLRGAAAVLLGERFGPPSAPALTPLLQATDPLLRAKACEALAVARAVGAADAVAALADDRAVPVRLAAALYLASIKDPRAEAVLERLTGDASTRGLAQPHFALGRLRFSRGELPSARSELETVVRLAPYNADALTLLAEIATRLGEPARAHALLQEALRFDPQNRIARSHLGDGG